MRSPEIPAVFRGNAAVFEERDDGPFVEPGARQVNPGRFDKILNDLKCDSQNRSVGPERHCSGKTRLDDAGFVRIDRVTHIAGDAAARDGNEREFRRVIVDDQVDCVDVLSPQFNLHRNRHMVAQASFLFGDADRCGRLISCIFNSTVLCPAADPVPADVPDENRREILPGQIAVDQGVIP